MWKYPPTADVGNVLAHITRPSLYVRNGVAAYGDDTTADTLFQDMTAEQAQFAETEAAYGGREAYEADKAEGKTELDYRQWVQVRTPAFKEWFGDWENSPEEASKVVNPRTGEPLVVYHYTEEQFDQFELAKARQYSDIPAFFFTTDPEMGMEYGSNEMQVFLNIRNLTKKPNISSGKDGKALREELVEQGYDGTIVDDSYDDVLSIEYAAFNPNQIKSATANSGAFSADNDSILYQSIYEDALDKMERAFGKMGVPVRRDTSRVSASEYLYAYLDDPDGENPRYVKFRASNHDLPAHYADNFAERTYDVKSGKNATHVTDGDWADAVKWFANEYGLKIPASVKASLTKRAQGYSDSKLIRNTIAHLENQLAAVEKAAQDDSITYTRSGSKKSGYFRDAGGKTVSTIPQLSGQNQMATKQEQIDALREMLSARLAEVKDQLLRQDARGMFDRMGNTIALLKNADASTFIHEFGHFELEVMSRIERDLRAVPVSEMTEGERQVLADFQTALDWFGVKDGDAWAAMSLEEQREHHEKFARGMEAYLFEGTAPSEALRGVFSRMARLLKRIYRSLLNLNVELSDDIRGVFDRLLASDGQIAETSYINGATLLFAEDAEFQAMDEAARREAEDELGRRALRDMAFARNARSREIRRLKREYKADFARAEMAARGSIMRQPVYRAWQLFTAKMTDEDRIDGNSKAEREFRRKAKVLQGKPVYTIATRTAPTDNKELRAWATELFDRIGNKAVHPEIGEVLLNARSVKDSMAHGMNADKAMAFEAVPSVLENGVIVAQTEHDGMTSYFVSAPVDIMGREDIVTALVRKDVNANRFYLHSVTTKENLLNAAPIESAADTDVSQPRGKLHSRDVASVLSKLLAYKPKTDRTALDPSSDTLMAAIAKLGGLNKDELVREWGLDAKDKIPAPVFGMPVLRRTKGRSIDEMAELLAEEGYLPTDNGKADVRDLEERFSDGLSGRDWYSRHYVPREERKAGEDVVNPYALNAVRLDEDSLAVFCAAAICRLPRGRLKPTAACLPFQTAFRLQFRPLYSLLSKPAMKNIVILISGRGSNMQAVVEAAIPDVRIRAVLSNNEHAAGLVWAAERGIATAALSHKNYPDRAAFDTAMAAEIDRYEPDLVVLAGFMRILTPEFCRRYEGRLINIHPSLLPAFPGLHTHRRALDAGCRLAGCTIHFVTPELDCGPVIAQGAVPVFDGDTADTLAERVLAVEHKLLPQAVADFAAGRLKISGNRVSNTRSADSDTFLSN